MPEMTVRRARREELERVNELRRMVNEVHVQGRPDIFKPGFNEALQRHVYELYDGEDSDVLVAIADGIIAGFAAVEYVRKPESPYSFARDYYHLKEFGVDAACRRQGVARALVDYMKTDAREKGFTRIELDAWAFNTGALAFYETVGFRTFRRYFEMDV